MSNQRSRWEGENQRYHAPGPALTLEFCIKKHLLGRILWSSKWLSLREKAQLHCIDAQKSAFVVCVGDNRKIDSTIPWVGGGGRKEAAVPLGLRKRENRSLCGGLEPKSRSPHGSVGRRGWALITKTTRSVGPPPPSSADHGLHIRLPLQVVLDLVCTCRVTAGHRTGGW